jgi:hypothetical protein
MYLKQDLLLLRIRQAGVDRCQSLPRLYSFEPSEYLSINDQAGVQAVAYVNMVRTEDAYIYAACDFGLPKTLCLLGKPRVRVTS